MSHEWAITRIPRQSCFKGHRGGIVLQWSNVWQAGRYSGTDRVWACLRHTRAAFAALRAREAGHLQAVAQQDLPPLDSTGWPAYPYPQANPWERHPHSNYPPQ